jgi:hypothetical protein
MAKKAKIKVGTRKDWTKEDLREFKAHSKKKTPVSEIVTAMERTTGALRQKARILGIPLGHRR